jgi:hypothetical protein
MEPLQALRHIGLSEKEAKVYLALLQLGRATAYTVAVKSGLKRPTTYLILDDLVRLGFAFESPRSLKKTFEAKPPEEVFALATERLHVAESALPSIQALVRKREGRTQALYFEGLDGLAQALKYRLNDLRGLEAVGFYGAAVGAAPEAVALAAASLADFKKGGVAMRGFIPQDKFIKPYVGQPGGPDFREIPTSIYSSRISIDTVGDMTRIMDIVSAIPQATIIENAEVAKTLRQIFERLWALEQAVAAPPKRGTTAKKGK